MNKVAQITVYFWFMKILATTLGETSGDLLSMTCQLGYCNSFLITMSFLALALVLQLMSKSFHPVFYWAVIVGTTSVGTEISDYMDRTLGLGYMAGSLILVTLLLSALGLWFYLYGNLEVYPITDRKKELLFWTAVLFSNTLGTAFGDFLSDNMGLNYTGGALVCMGIIVVVMLLHYFSRINQVILFWIAFIFTRPFGATFGDLLTKPVSHGGLNIPRGHASLVTVALLLAVLAYSHWMSRKPVHGKTA